MKNSELSPDNYNVKSNDLLDREYKYSNDEVARFIDRIDVNADLTLNNNITVKRTLMMMPDPANKVVLDIGTGEGRWARYLASSGSKNVFGIDICQDMIDEAMIRSQQKDLNVNFSCSRIEDFHKYDFDLVNSFFAVNYIKDLDIFFKEVNKRLVDGGDFIFSTKSIEHDDNISTNRNKLLVIVDDKGHSVHSYQNSLEDYVNFAYNNNFEITDFFRKDNEDQVFGSGSQPLDLKVADIVVLCKKTDR